MDNQDFLHYFESYLLNERHYSDQTAKAYLADCQDFICFLKETGEEDLKRVSYADARIYLTYLTDQEYERSTIARKISSLRALYYFLLKNEEVGSNPFAQLNMKTSAKQLPDFFYEQEMEELFRACQGDQALDYRNAALLELFYATGIRLNECVHLKMEDVDFAMSLIFVRGKGNKDRYIPFGSFAADALKEYFEKGRQVLMDHHHKDHDYVFVNHHADPLTPQGVEYILDQIVKKSSLTADIHPQKIRHSFATHLLNKGADIRAVQELLGHSSLSSTQVYTHVTKEHLQAEYNKYFSRS